VAASGKHRIRGTLACVLLSGLGALALTAQPAGVLGDWQDPTGSVIHIGRCGGQVCLWLLALSPSAPAATDIHNPDPSLRSRALCGLEIGSGFTLRDPDHAAGGSLYDPKTGKTYHGSMTAVAIEGTSERARLELRGYVGIPLFGESQTWIRPSAPVKTCSDPTKSPYSGSRITVVRRHIRLVAFSSRKRHLFTALKEST
jgi:uncharacterized protein (DUF2147 family)